MKGEREKTEDVGELVLLTANLLGPAKAHLQNAVTAKAHASAGVVSRQPSFCK